MAGKGNALQTALEKWKKDQSRLQADQTLRAEEKAKKAKKSRGSAKTAKAAAAGSGADMKTHLRTVVATKPLAVPLSKQLKDCLDALQRAQEPLTGAELQQLTGHDCDAGSALAEHLSKNPRVDFKGGQFRFRAAAEVKVQDRAGALKFIQSSKGCAVKDLTAAYPEAETDVKHLQSEGVVWLLPAAEKDQKAVFPRDKPPLISVSQEILKLWHEVEVPDDPEEQSRDIKKANIVSAVQRGMRERPWAVKKKEKKKRAVNFDRFKRITNEHLPELFVGEAATSID